MLLVHNQDEWNKVKSDSEASFGVDAVERVWFVPEEFPLLVDFVWARNYLNICAVYLADAVMLCQAAGMDFKDPASPPSQPQQLQRAPKQRLKPREYSSQPSPLVVNTVGAGQKSFNLLLYANLQTIVKLLVDTGICKEADYEKRLSAAVAEADQAAEAAVERFASDLTRLVSNLGLDVPLGVDSDADDDDDDDDDDFDYEL